MKALICKGDGNPAVEVADLDEPVPGKDEILVDVRAASVNRGELRLLSSRPRGWRPGQDVAGVVLEPASNGAGPDRGSRVVAWVDEAGWAQRVTAPVDRVAVLEDSVSFAEAATLPVAGMTALRALRQGRDLLGRRVLVTGAAGGVGRFAVELAGRSGAKVTGVVRDEQRSSGLVDLGAHEVLYDIDDAEGPFDLILESVGGHSLSRSLELAAHGGTVVVFGSSSAQPATFGFQDFAQRPVRIQIFFVYQSGGPFGPDLQLLADLVADGSLHPQVGMKVDWLNTTTAFEALAARQVNGKAVLEIS